MSKELNVPMVEDAIKYIRDFGGYAKACQAESSACFCLSSVKIKTKTAADC